MHYITLIEDKKLWDFYLNKYSQYAFYDTFCYHTICSESQNGKPTLLVYENNNELIIWSFLSRKITQMPIYRDITSVYGYNSIYAYNISDPKKTATKILNFLKEKNFVSIFSRLNPLDEINEFTHQLGKIEFLGRTVPIYLTDSTLEEQISNYRKSTRYEIKKALNQGITCHHDTSCLYLDQFIEIYYDTMKSLGASSFYFFSKHYFKKILTSYDYNARLYICFKDNVAICGGIFVFCNKVVQYHLSGTHKNYYSLSPNKVMIDQVLSDARNEKMNVFHLGGGLGAQEDFLFKFKSGFSKKTLDFFVLKSIINNEIYTKLIPKKVSDENSSKDFFPEYRCKE